MRIVHILTRLLRAGSEENTLLTCAGQINDGHEVILVHGHDYAPEFGKHLAPGIELVEARNLTRDLRPLADLAAFWEIRRLLTKLKPDIVHTHQSKAGIIGRFAAAAAGIPVIVHGVHILPFLGETGPKKAMFLQAELAAAHVTSAFIHVSDGMRNACLSHGIGSRSPHYVVRSGFDLRRFADAARPEEWRTMLRLALGDTTPPVIAMLASLEPRKRHIEFLDHVPRLLSHCPTARIVFAGEGFMRDEIEAKITEMGLGERVFLLGYRSDPENIIAMADVCIHCAGKEGLPRSVLQYLAAGRPTLTFHLPGIEEVIADGTNGVIIPQEDWVRYIETLARLIRDAGARATLAERARQTRLDGWDASAMANRTLAIYRDLKNGQAKPAAAM